MRERSNATWRRPIAALGLVLSLLAVAGCFGDGGSDGSGSPSPSPSSSSPSPVPTGANGLPVPVASTAWALPTETGEQSKDGGPFVKVSVYGIYRQGDAARLVMGATIVGAGPDRGVGINPAPGYDYGTEGWHVFAPEATTDNLDVSGLTLVDSTSQRAYLTARNANGDCVCSQGPGANGGSPVVGGSTTLLRAAFTDLPASLDRLDVRFPKMGGVLPGVPVTDRPVPEVLDSPPEGLRTPDPGEDYAPVLVSKVRSTDLNSAKSTVRRLTLPTSTLDRSVTEERDKVILAADVLFAFDKAKLTSKAKSRIHKAAEVLRKRAKGTVHVNGYTDSKGSESYNKALSKRRAEAVRGKLKGMLKGAGLDLVAKGFGEADPVAPNTKKGGADNPEGRALNRRVEIRYTPKPKATHTSAPSVTTTPSPRPSGTPTPDGAIAEHKAQFGGGDVDGTVQAYRLYQHGGLVTLDFGVHIPRSSGGQAAALGSGQVPVYDLSAAGSVYNSVNGVALADTGHNRLYLTGRYKTSQSVFYKLSPKAQCLCSQAVPSKGGWDPYPGQTMYLSATYAAPPAGVDSLDVHVRQSPLADHDDPVVLKDIPIEGR